ncbi:BbrUII/HgiDII family restriction enzyme [Luteimonas arsenica]|uniref:BbrUII/HgiDII family restriction enzyme n=1 Tax=Luteimonas arsenica TaxID=1586242 RepID=UPI001054B800|nr:ATP-binding protein [Luteimonas arsenica]
MGKKGRDKKIPAVLRKSKLIPSHPQKYELQIDLSVLDHLGINLYSNVPAVMTEMVANAWDADATEVNITVDTNADIITVTDNGIGMTAEEINKKFLTVGYRRREEASAGGRSPSGRPVMGRKGVGKLAPFSIADQVEVFSVKDGEKSGLRMTIDGIRQAQSNKTDKKYHPEVLDGSTETPERGTKIVLRKLKNERVKRANLRSRLARRFSIIGTDQFAVTIDEKEVTSRDRGDLEKLQYIWTIGGWEKPDWCTPTREFTLQDRLDGWEDGWAIRGWIGTSHKPKDLASVAGNLNGIVVIARGRLFQENILAEFNDGRHYTKYLTGQIEADFLDEGPNDIATSDRQRLIEDDPRYVQLNAYLQKVLGILEAGWSKNRAIDDPKKVQIQYPQVQEWIQAMPDAAHRKHAEKLVGAVERMEIEGKDKEELLKHAIFGFERMRLRGLTEELVHAIEMGDAEMVKLFMDQDDLEATVYRDIVKGRLNSIQLLKNAVSRNDKEKVLQKILFDRLWLLDPSWERATGTEEIEKQFKSIFPPESSDGDDESKDHSKGRFDITYRTIPGKHVIVELKRAKRQVSLLELAEQGNKYVDELKRLLVKHGEAEDPEKIDVEVIFVLGDRVSEQYSNPDRYKFQMNSISPGSRICTYDELTTNALNSYSEYLARTKRLGELAKLVDSIGAAS